MLWDTSRWLAVATWRGGEGEVGWLGFSADDRRLSALAGGRRTTWDVGTEAELRSAELGLPPREVRVPIPGERWVVGARGDGTLEIRDRETGEEAARLPHHLGKVLGLAAHPDGTVFVSVAQDRHLKVWGPRPGGMAGVKPVGFLGIQIGTDAADQVVVTGVYADTPAAEAGLAQGDVLVEIDGRRPANPTEAVDLVRRVQEGETVRLEMLRGAESVHKTVRLGSRPAEMQD